MRVMLQQLSMGSRGRLLYANPMLLLDANMMKIPVFVYAAQEDAA